MNEYYLINSQNFQISFFFSFCFRKGFLLNLTGLLVLMDLSKEYDSVNHELVIAKLSKYRLNENSLRLIQNCLLKNRQWVKEGSSLEKLFKIILSTLQRSILGPILLNFFLNDLHFFIKQADARNFDDDTSP